MSFLIATGGYPRFGNDFAVDVNCYALYRFESGALTTDSKSTNTLTNNNTVTANTSTYKEGAASADLLASSTQYFSRTDTNLSSGFPFKSGDSTKNISICAWFRLRSDLTDEEEAAIASKYDSGTSQRTYRLRVYNLTGTGMRMYFTLGYDSGTLTETFNHASILSSGVWYHVTASYQDSGKSVAIRIRDASGNVVGTDYTSTMTNDIYVGTADLQIGARAVSPVDLFDGYIDEVVFFNDIISSAEATKIAQGVYP